MGTRDRSIEQQHAQPTPCGLVEDGGPRDRLSLCIGAVVLPLAGDRERSEQPGQRWSPPLPAFRCWYTSLVESVADRVERTASEHSCRSLADDLRLAPVDPESAIACWSVAVWSRAAMPAT